MVNTPRYEAQVFMVNTPRYDANVFMVNTPRYEALFMSCDPSHAMRRRGTRSRAHGFALTRYEAVISRSGTFHIGFVPSWEFSTPYEEV
jgi:hypothetical protein